MKIAAFLFFISSLLGTLRPCRAEGPGSTSFNFLKIGVGARQIAMAEATTAVSDDLNAAFYNPAALGKLGRQEVSFLYTRWLEDISYQYMAYAHPTLRWGTFSGSLHYLSWGRIQGYDAQGQQIGSFRIYDWAGSLGWGKELGKGFTGGWTAKYIQESIESVSASVPAFDFGLLYRREEGEYLHRFAFGAAVRNLGPTAKFISESEKLPMSFDAGVSYRALADALTLAVDMHKFSDNQMAGSMGGEYLVKEVVALRMGYRTGEDLGNGFNAGFGIQIGDGRFDYALTNFGMLGYTHRVGVSYRFGGNVEALYQQGLSNMRLRHYEEAILNFDKVLMLEPGHRKALIQLKACHQKLVQEQKELSQQ